MDKATLADITLDEFLDVKIDSLQKRIEHDRKELERLISIRSGGEDVAPKVVGSQKKEPNDSSYFTYNGQRLEVSQRNIKKLVFDILKENRTEMSSTAIYDAICNRNLVEDVKQDRRRWIMSIGLCLGNFLENEAIKLQGDEKSIPKVYKLINPDFM